MLTAMDKRTQQAYIYWRAPELARSGQFRNWQDIEIYLRREGIYEASRELHGPFYRNWLNSLCEEARNAQGTEG
jgi:hypothetical protein